MCLNSPEDTSLLILRHTEEPVFVIKEEDFQVFTNPNLDRVQAPFVYNFQRIELVADVVVSAPARTAGLKKIRALQTG